MKRNTLKNSLLSTVLIIGAFGSVVALNSNESETAPTTTFAKTDTSKETKEDVTTLKLWTSWSKNGVQDYALKQIVKVYNEGPGNDAGVQIEVINQSGGYSAITENIQQNIRSGSLDQLPDLYIGYNANAASLIELGEEEKGTNLALDVAEYNDNITNNLIPSMQASNQQIVGAEEGEVYTVPFATSSELMGIDAPLLIWMLQQFEDAGGTVNFEGDIAAQIIDAADGQKDGSLTTSEYVVKYDVQNKDDFKISYGFIYQEPQKDADGKYVYNDKDELLDVDGEVITIQEVSSDGTAAGYTDGDAITKEHLEGTGPVNKGDTQLYNKSGEVYTIGDKVYAPLATGNTGSDADLTSLKAGDIQGATSEDLALIEQQWRPTGADLAGETININDDLFSSGVAMLKLGEQLLSAVEPLQDSSKQGIFGFDAPVNNFYTYAQAETNSIDNPENGLLYKDGDDVIYAMLEQDSEQWKQAEEIFNFFRDGFMEGIIWTPNNGVIYGSNLFMTHSLPFSIGSTAGATHYATTFDGDQVNPGEMVFIQPPGRLSEEGTRNVQMQQGPGIGGVKQFTDNSAKTEDEVRNQQIADFLTWLTGDVKAKFPTGISSSYIYANTYFDTDAEGNELINQLGLNSTDNPNPFGATEEEVISNLDDDKKHPNADFVAANPPSGYLPVDDYGVEYAYWEIEGTTDYVFADSYYGLELFEYNDGVVGSAIQVAVTNDTEELTPSIYMSQESGYIVGTKATFDDPIYKTKMEDPYVQSNGTWSGAEFTQNKYGAFGKDTLIGPSIAYATINEASGDAAKDRPTAELIVEPSSVYSDTFRSGINEEIGQMKTTAALGKEPKTAEDALISLHNDAVKAGAFDGKVIMVWKWWMTLLIVLLSLTVIGGIAFVIWLLLSKNKKEEAI